MERIIEIYQRSLANLARALAVFDEVALYDSSIHRRPPRLVRVYDKQRIAFDEPPVPLWLASIAGDGGAGPALSRGRQLAHTHRGESPRERRRRRSGRTMSRCTR
jgi:hypothetical protein